tara:strand:+ start:3551 stop:5968 length:2418 start_codon:yes stop_codon:yes gene_type:complete
MARIAQGRGIRAIPILTSGLSDRVYVANGEAREVDGCYFQVVGRVEKVKGIRGLVDWEWLTPHLLNTRVNAITSYTVPGGPTELVVSISGDSSKAEPHYTSLANTIGPLSADKYKAGRILVVRGNSLEKAGLPHIGEGSPWEEQYSSSPEGNQFIAARRTEGTDPFEGDYFSTWGGYLFISNGVDANLKWNGDYASRIGVHEIPSPPSAAKVSPDPDGQLALDPDFSINDEFVGIGEGDRGNDLSSVQTMQYRATFVSESGAEGSPSEPGNTVKVGEIYKNASFHDTRKDVIGTGGGENCWIEEPEPPLDGSGGTPLSRNPHRALIKITGFDRPSQSDIVWRNIYKRAKDGEYYFWRQICVNQRVVYDHEDAVDSAALGSPLAERLTPPPTSKYIAFFKGRGYYVTDSSPSFVFYSDQDLPEQVSDPNQFLDVNSRDNSDITGMVAMEDSLIIFKEDSIYQVTGSSDGTPVLTPVNESVGCVAPRASILAYERIVFVGRDGVYQYNGGSIKPLSANLNKWWKNVSTRGLRNAVSWLDEKERRLFIALPSGPGNENDTVLCYHYQLDAVTVIKGQKVTAAAHYKGESVLGIRHDERSHKEVSVRDSPRIPTTKGKTKKAKSAVDSIQNSDLILWGLGDSFDYKFRPGTADQGKLPTVSAGSCSGRIKFGPYGQTQTGWSSGEEMEVSGIDVFFPYTGEHSVTVKWYKNRNPVAEGQMSFALNKFGTLANKEENTDLESKIGWGDSTKTWGSSTWNGRPQLMQRLVFPNSVVCREIEIEFENGTNDEPFSIDSFVLWRTSKGAERQR